MKKHLQLIAFFVLIISVSAKAQTDFDPSKFKIDTISPPNDNITLKIKGIRKERGNFNIQQIAIMKIKEEQKKDTVLPKEYYQRLLNEFENGDAKRLLENVALNMYRQCFNEKELNDLLVFYKTSAGKKIASDFMLTMITSAKFAEKVADMTSKKVYAEMKQQGKIQ